MKIIIYNGPGHVLVAGEHRIQRGVPTEISEKLFQQLQRDPSMTLQVVKASRRASKSPATQADQQAATQADQNADNGEED